jgi:hypothetical protein
LLERRDGTHGVLIPVTATIFFAGEDLISPSPEEGCREDQEYRGVFSTQAGGKTLKEAGVKYTPKTHRYSHLSNHASSSLLLTIVEGRVMA